MKTRKNRWKLLVLVVGLFLLGPGAWHFFGLLREPAFEGKSVSYWFEEYYLNSGSERLSPYRFYAAQEALEQLGTSAVPYLVKQATSDRKDWSGREVYYELLKIFPDTWRNSRYVSQENIRQKAVDAIRLIEPPAGVLIPLLGDALSQTNTPRCRLALSILNCAGEERELLVPYLATALHDPYPRTQEHALEFLQELKSKASGAVPELIALLQQTDLTNILHEVAAFTLGSIGSNAAPAVPLLRMSFEQKTNWIFRLNLAASILRIDASQTNALHHLIQILKDTQDSDKVQWAASRLSWIGPNAVPAIPALLDALRTTNYHVWTGVMNSLKEIGAAEEQYLPYLREKFKSHDEASRYVGAARVLAIDPTDRDAQAVMIDMITNHSDHELRAIYSLGYSGTNAQAAIPLILDTLNGTNSKSWRAACEALGRIGAPTELILPKLKEKLQSTNDLVRVKFAETILENDPGDQEALLTLVDLIKTKPQYLRMALDLLGEAGPAAQLAIPALRELTKSPDGGIRYFASKALRKVEAKPHAK